ncbi:HutD family protein [Glutamicibacter sp. MNS18]|uniref:HutD/Ves family protein n=1 Tax=Glutamicibacter sp. MNS18 TaxID=2989817 RepID=UPI00278BC02F|nr:HutD family protein [Glutamicibacter sp. MNS18]
MSITDVDAQGEFSAFPGLTRILTIIRGEGMSLTIDGTEQWLDSYRPLRFDGSATTSATLPRGPIRNLNLMFRSSRLNGEVELRNLIGPGQLTLGQSQLAILLQGAAQVTAGHDGHAVLSEFDSVIGNQSASTTVTGSGMLAVITLTRIEG